MSIVNDKITIILLKPNKIKWSIGIFVKNKHIILGKIIMIMGEVNYYHSNLLVETYVWAKNNEKFFSKFKI